MRQKLKAAQTYFCKLSPRRPRRVWWLASSKICSLARHGGPGQLRGRQLHYRQDTPFTIMHYQPSFFSIAFLPVYQLYFINCISFSWSSPEGQLHYHQKNAQFAIMHDTHYYTAINSTAASHIQYLFDYHIGNSNIFSAS